jgi:cytochrome c biogenesis protein CcmG, thiol:disulfide interchange protein DsbE
MTSLLTVGLALIAQRQTLDPQQVAAKLKERLSKIESFTVEAESRPAKGKPSPYTIKALRPAYFQVQTPTQWFMGDGSGQMTIYQVLQSEYMKMPWGKDGVRIPLGEGFSLFNPPADRKDNFTKAEETTFDAKKAIVLTNELEGAQPVQFRTYIDPETWLPLASEQIFMGTVDLTVYKRIVENPGLKPADFSWTPPKGVVDAATKPRVEAKYLEVGQQAPNFIVSLLDGRKITLDQALKGKKALLVNFWFIHCGYCLLEMPEFETLYQQTKSKGFELVAVNDVDTKDEVDEFIKKLKYRFPVGLDAGAKIAKEYLVADKGHPVSYLIGPDRMVLYVQIGYDTENKLAKLQAELAKVGIKP